MSFVLLKNPTKASIKAAVERIAHFLYRDSKEITKFFLSSSKYRSMVIRMTKNSDAGTGSFDLELAVYEDGKTHRYAESLTRDELKRIIKEIEA